MALCQRRSNMNEEERPGRAETEQPKLTEAEWALIVELLEREFEELPVEIHHSRTASYREELRARRERVRSLLVRPRPVAVV